MTKIPDTLVMTEDYWHNTHLSVVRHFGHIRFRGFRYIIVDKRGKDIWECSREADLLGRDKAIPAGEPCDLIWDRLQPAYRTLGRDRILQLLKDGSTYEDIKAEVKKARESKIKDFEKKQPKILPNGKQ